MASTFWYLEDGRGFARRWSGMFYMLKLINNEIKLINGAEDFSQYLDHYIWDEEADEYNGYGGFIRASTSEDIMPEIDLREFTETNRNYFWKGAQNALRKLIIANDEKYEGIIFLMKNLLDMHKRIKRGENPQLLNHLKNIEPYSGEKKGPGWE
ncbi:hypothetical protein HYN59_13415 [Flavobacterium album]|uniref:Uncharacterized protein n=1 Tax=Flavobacterium album TaxID=2175091 RepID=A0A2S1R057_9FLAO|nr:hypothetical protein [Flavobacterium album]AWH86048.1 hypothetical protein HYN59_13415 [Flavobacterium album]